MDRTATNLDQIGTDNLRNRPVTAFDQPIRLAQADQFQGVLVPESDSQVDETQCGQYCQSVCQRIDWPVFTLTQRSD